MTSKPSTTNCPNAFAVLVLSDVMVSGDGVVTVRSCVQAVKPHLTRCRNRASARQCPSELVIALTLQRYSGGYCSGVPPLPIPNREVKPACADGTAMQCGRVGGRHLSRSPVSAMRQGFFRCISQVIYQKLAFRCLSAPCSCGSCSLRLWQEW